MHMQKPLCSQQSILSKAMPFQINVNSNKRFRGYANMSYLMGSKKQLKEK